MTAAQLVRAWTTRSPVATTEAPRWPRRLGNCALVAIAAAVMLMAATDALGRSAAVPRIDGAWPPWSAHVHPSQQLVTYLLWAALTAGALGVLAGLLAVRGGWRPATRRLLLAAAIACAVLAVTPPAGSTDSVDYAVYGEQAALGQSPYTHTPEQLRTRGDPVGAYAPRSWQGTTSVYGPLATGVQWVAAELGDGSAARTVFWIKVMNAAAFLGVGVLLDRRARAGGSSARAHLLWTLNPLLLWQLLSGAHIDALATVAALAAVLTAPGLAAGLLVGAAAAVKAPYLLVGVGVLWAARRSPRRLAWFAVGVVAVLGTGYAIAGRPAVSDVLAASAHGAEIDPWRPLATLLDLRATAPSLELVSVVVSVLLAALLLHGLPRPAVAHGDAARPALAAVLGWLLPAPYQHPWYDAPAFALSATLAASAFDVLLVLHCLTGSLTYLPGVVPPPPGSLPSDLMLLPGIRVAPLVLAAIMLGFAVVGLRTRRRTPSTTPR